MCNSQCYPQTKHTLEELCM